MNNDYYFAVNEVAITEYVGDRIKEFIRDRYGTITAFREKYGIPPQTINNHLNGVTRIKVVDLMRYAKLLGVDPAELLPDSKLRKHRPTDEVVDDAVGMIVNAFIDNVFKEKKKDEIKQVTT